MTITTPGELRGFLADVLVDIRGGTVTVDKAIAIAKVAAQINQSLAVEVNSTLQLKKMGAGAVDLPAIEDAGTWCEQCEMRVSALQAGACKSKFCKAKPA